MRHHPPRHNTNSILNLRRMKLIQSPSHILTPNLKLLQNLTNSRVKHTNITILNLNSNPNPPNSPNPPRLLTLPNPNPITPISPQLPNKHTPKSLHKNSTKPILTPHKLRIHTHSPENPRLGPDSNILTRELRSSKRSIHLSQIPQRKSRSR